MGRCTQCGAEMPDYYAKCANCGGQIAQTGPAAPQMGGYVSPAAQPRVITSTGGWFGWLLLCSVLPIIGPIIMLSSSQDETAKNYAKLMIILQAISIVCSLIFQNVFAPALLDFLEEAAYSMTILPFL